MLLLKGCCGCNQGSNEVPVSRLVKSLIFLLQSWSFLMQSSTSYNTIPKRKQTCLSEEFFQGSLQNFKTGWWRQPNSYAERLASKSGALRSLVESYTPAKPKQRSRKKTNSGQVMVHLAKHRLQRAQTQVQVSVPSWREAAQAGKQCYKRVCLSPFPLDYSDSTQ